MIEVPVFEFGLHAPVVAEMGEGGPATAPGYALHGVWGEAGSDVVCCWQVRDDFVSLCAVNPHALQDRTVARPLRRIRFGGTVLPKPLLLTVDGGHEVSQRLIACTSEGHIKIVPLKITEMNIDVRPPFATIQLPHTQRVCGCIFIPKRDSSTVLAFVGLGVGAWGQRELDGQALSEVKVVELLGESESREHASLKFTSWIGRQSKVTAFTATADPVTRGQFLIVTLQGCEAVVYSVRAKGVPQDIRRFPVTDDPDAQFSTDVTAVVSGSSLVLAFVQLKPESSVLVFNIDFTSQNITHEAPLRSPLGEGVSARASVRNTSTGLYVVWQAEAPPTDAAAAAPDALVPLLFSHLPTEPAAPLVAISYLPLVQTLAGRAAWRVVDFASSARGRLKGADASHDVGVCVIDGAALPAADVCCIMRPGGLSVLRQAEAFETQPLVRAPADAALLGGAADDNGDAVYTGAALDHPYVSYSAAPLACGGDDEFLVQYAQLAAVVGVTQAERVGQILHKFLQPRASPDSVDAMASCLNDVTWLSHGDETRQTTDMLDMDVPHVLGVCRQLLARVDSGCVDVRAVPLAVIGAAHQLSFALLVLSVQLAVVASVARSLARDAVLREAEEVLSGAIERVVLHAHVYRVLQYRTPPALIAEVVGKEVTPARILSAVKDVTRMLLTLAPVSTVPAASFLTALFGSPAAMYGHVRGVFSLAGGANAAASAHFKRLVASHAYANAIVLHSSDAAGEFTTTAELLRRAPPADQRAFIAYVLSLLPQDSQPPWVALDCIGSDVCTVYLYLSVRSLCHVYDELRKTDDCDVAFGRSTVTLGQVVRSTAVAVLPAPAQLLSGMVLWTPADWDLVANVHSWASDDAIDDCRRAVPHAAATAPAVGDLCARWDRAFRTVLSCVDPHRQEQQLSTLVDAVLASGPVATQRFLTAQWSATLPSPIEATISPDGSGHALISVTLPPVTPASSSAYRRARAANSKLGISIVTGPSGSGVGLVETHDGASQVVMGSVVVVGTENGRDRYQASVSVELRGATKAEARSVLVVVGYAGVPARILRCAASPSSPLAVLPHHKHLACPATTISRLLWARGNDKSIHELISNQRVPNYYEFLAQYLLQRSEFRAAARVTYRIAERIRTARHATLQDQLVSAHALSVAKEMLLYGGETSFGLHSDDPAKCTARGAVAVDPGNPVVITLESLEHKRISVEAEAELLRREAAANPNRPLQPQQCSSEETLDMLCKRRLLFQAASYGAAWDLDLSDVFSEGIAACLEAEASKGMTAREKAALWDEVLALLDHHSTAAVQWKYHVVALSIILRGGVTPPPRVVDPLSKHRPDTVIREAVKKGTPATLALAARLATSYQEWRLAQQHGAQHLAADLFAATAAVPHTLMDTLVAAVGAARGADAALDAVAGELFQHWRPKA